MLFFLLFLTFFQIGLFGFGGGYAMISLIQGEVVTHHHWLTMSEFTDIVAISQMTPGPVGINMATYVGYNAVVHAGYAPWLGVIGSTIATCSVMLPSFILMLFLAKFLIKHRDNATLTTTFRTLRITVVGLLLAAFLLLLTPDNFNLSTPLASHLSPLTSIIIFLSTFVAVFRFKVNPIYCLLLSALLGAILM